MKAASALYDDPRVYESVHRPGTAEEAALLRDVFALHGNGGRRWLEPACGTGRLLAALAGRGFSVCGYDVSLPALDYARRRLRRFGSRARVFPGDMRSFRAPGPFDAAFNLIGTIRHLLRDADVLAHLRLVAAMLAPGGIYIVGLDLVDYDLAEDDEETWPGHVMMSLAPDRRRRRERIVNFISHGGRLIEASYDLRSYSREQWRALLAKSPLRVVDERLFPALGAPAAVRDALYVLKK